DYYCQSSDISLSVLF
nr:immunoglobulin light chain junction region [Macaca mulatta]MOX77427.1 immunoglobulin light chain junction region [Macaca mulatta]MOX77494.1 immunoglobulin light chain junction region [Macaca mulatta]MOX77518.1 immunoglobulin light chain junction region [Macaca mulatta]MOX77519.1 immunoglobulin light chain junction region [Macaca mulatta]